MNESIIQRDPVEQLAEEFLARVRSGERPTVSEYTIAHPELADEIHDLFPALMLMEEAKPVQTEPHGPALLDSHVPPEKLGDYRILREIARGGMGVVYEAEQVALGRHVALKVLLSAASGDPLRLLRFRREARSAAKLHHTNIVPVFDVGSTDSVHYYAMQFIQGQGLDEVLQELRRLRSGEKSTDLPNEDLTASLVIGLQSGQFPQAPVVPVPRLAATTPRSETSTILTEPVSHYCRSVARLGIQAADALAYAHGQRVLHRDVKPSNLLLDRQGTLWLTDFGLAKDDGDDLTRFGDIVGTIRYMAPERFKGVSDPRTDVYALGVTLYEMLTLRAAFPTPDRMLLIHQITKEEPTRPRTIDPTIPRDLETIVLKAIEKDPGRRYPTAADMAEDLRRFMADRPIKARRASWREQVWRWCRRNPGIAASLSSALAFLMLLVVGLSFAALRVWHAKLDVESAKAEIEKRLAEEKQSVYFHRIALADRELAANNLARAEELLDLCPLELRRWEWHYLKRSRGKPPLILRHDHPITGRAHLSPDGRRIATAGSNGSVTIWDLATAKVVRVIPAHSNRGWLVVYSPNGRYLASSDESRDKTTASGEIKIWNSDTGDLLQRIDLNNRFVNGMAFSPDGLRLAVSTYAIGQGEETLEIRDSSTGHVLVAMEAHRASTQGVAFSPDGLLVASASCDQIVRLSDARTGKTVWEFHDQRPGEHPYWCVAFSSDGKRLAAGYGVETDQDPGGVRVFEVQSGRELVSLTGHAVHAVSFSADGRLASGGLDATVRIWDPDRAQPLLTLRGFTDVVRSLEFTPDGHRLVTVSEDRTVRVWDATPLRGMENVGDELFTLVGHDNCVNSVIFHPNQSLLASASSDGTIRLWNTRDGFTANRVFRTRLDHVHAIAFNPSGDRLACVGQPATGCAVLEASSGLVLQPLEVEIDEWPRRVTFSTDGKLLAGCNGDGTILFWAGHSGKPRRLQGNLPWTLGFAFAPNSEHPLLAVASTSGMVYLWDPKSEKHVRSPLNHLSASAVNFSPDGTRLATVGWDRVVRVWNAKTWQIVDQVRDPSGSPNCVTFSPDGKLLAWGGTDSTVKVWRLGSEEVTTLRGHRNWVWDVAFSPKGDLIASSGRDATVKVWKSPTFEQK